MKYLYLCFLLALVSCGNYGKKKELLKDIEYQRAMVSSSLSSYNYTKQLGDTAEIRKAKEDYAHEQYKLDSLTIEYKAKYQ
jgi:hypothetical protein